MGREQDDNVLLLARHEGLDLPQLCPICQLTLLEMLRDTDLSWYLPRDRDLLQSRDCSSESMSETYQAVPLAS